MLQPFFFVIKLQKVFFILLLEFIYCFLGFHLSKNISTRRNWHYQFQHLKGLKKEELEEIPLVTEFLGDLRTEVFLRFDKENQHVLYVYQNIILLLLLKWLNSTIVDIYSIEALHHARNLYSQKGLTSRVDSTSHRICMPENQDLQYNFHSDHDYSGIGKLTDIAPEVRLI